MDRCALSFRHWHGRDVLDRGRGVISHWLSVVSAVAWEGVIAGQSEDENLKEIAARFTKETGRPVWRELTEIPATTPGNKRS